MEITPELELDSGEETSDEVSSTESPPEESVQPIDKEDFERRVNSLVEMMQDDSNVRDRILAEIYVNMASAEMGIRGVFESIQNGGMAGLMKGAFSRRKD